MNKISESLKRNGVAISEMPKGIPRTRYYTPDGREELKIPQHHIRQDGVVYDIFLAEGYTLTPPVNPKPYCAGCDKWHDTQDEVDKCIEKKKQFAESMQKKAKEDLAKERQTEDDEIADLKTRLDKLTVLLEETLGKKI